MCVEVRPPSTYRSLALGGPCGPLFFASTAEHCEPPVASGSAAKDSVEACRHGVHYLGVIPVLGLWRLRKADSIC